MTDQYGPTNAIVMDAEKSNRLFWVEATARFGTGLDVGSRCGKVHGFMNPH
jgi:hypothetical protein